MSKPPKKVTDAELAVLETLWEREPTTIRAITDHLYPGGGTSHYATVQKLLERLEGKRLVRRNRRQTPHRFTSKIDRGKLIASRLREVADSLCEGSVAPLLTSLLGGGRLTEDELRELRQTLDMLEAEGGKG